MPDTLPPHELGNQLAFALYDASRALIRAYGPLLAALGLTYPQYITMLVLWGADDAVSVGDLGARLNLDSGTLSPLIKRLERLGLVNRRRDPADERRVLISLTTEGSDLRSRSRDLPARVVDQLGLSTDTAIRLRDDLISVVQILGANVATSDL